MNQQKQIVILCIYFVLVLSMPDAGIGATFPDFSSSTSGEVLKNIQDSDNLYIEKEGRYCLKKEDCSICWEVTVAKEDKKITLSLEQPLGVSCSSAFTKQLPLHRKIFTEIFTDWKKDRFQTVFTGPLDRLEPTNTWNKRIALASASSSDWIGWRENYPNHSSKKSSNQIFVELAKQVDACRELLGLFKEFGLKVELNYVEKVFAKKAKALPFYQELKSDGLEGNPKLMYDAGMINFSVLAIDQTIP